MNAHARPFSRWKAARRRFATAFARGADQPELYAAASALLRAHDALVPLLPLAVDGVTHESWRACRRWRRMAVRTLAGEEQRPAALERIHKIAAKGRHDHDE